MSINKPGQPKMADGTWQKVLELRRAYNKLVIGPDERISKIVVEALARMPDEVREIIILKIFIELTWKEIAYVCGMLTRRAVGFYNHGLNEIGLLLEGKGRGSDNIG